MADIILKLPDTPAMREVLEYLVKVCEEERGSPLATSPKARAWEAFVAAAETTIPSALEALREETDVARADAGYNTGLSRARYYDAIEARIRRLEDIVAASVAGKEK